MKYVVCTLPVISRDNPPNQKVAAQTRNHIPRGRRRPVLPRRYQLPGGTAVARPRCRKGQLYQRPSRVGGRRRVPPFPALQPTHPAGQSTEPRDAARTRHDRPLFDRRIPPGQMRGCPFLMPPSGRLPVQHIVHEQKQRYIDGMIARRQAGADNPLTALVINWPVLCEARRRWPPPTTGRGRTPARPLQALIGGATS